VTQDSLVVIIGMAVCGSLSGAVVFLFGLNQKANTKTQDKLEEFVKETRQDLKECRNDRESLWQKITELQVEIGKMMRS
jgi:uncharacterized protein YlxW (UPF0749 family)